MWRSIKIEDSIYFIQFSIKNQNVVCVLTNLEDCWCEKLSIEKLLKRSKELNKRILFDKTTVLDTLKDAEPAEVVWHKTLKDITIESQCDMLLKLKYTVRKVPLKFDWLFRKQQKTENQKLLFTPLLHAFQNVVKQNAVLREEVRKKDVEISQYKTEGCKLRRTTVATQPFNFQKFESKHDFGEAEINSLIEFAKQLEEHYQTMQTETLSEQQIVSVPEPTSSPAPTQSENKPESAILKRRSGRLHKSTGQENEKSKSPRDRKRTALQTQQNHAVTKLKAIKKSLQYESESQETDEAQTPKPSTPPTEQAAKKVRKSFSQDLEAVAADEQTNVTEEVVSTEVPKVDSVNAITSNNGINQDSTEPNNENLTSRDFPKFNSLLDKIVKEVRKSPEMEPLFMDEDDFDEQGFLKVKTLNCEASTSHNNAPISKVVKNFAKHKEKLNGSSNNSSESQHSNNSLSNSQQIDAILKEWKELEERRLADLKRRRES